MTRVLNSNEGKRKEGRGGGGGGEVNFFSLQPAEACPWFVHKNKRKREGGTRRSYSLGLARGKKKKGREREYGSTSSSLWQVIVGGLSQRGRRGGRRSARPPKPKGEGKGKLAS